MGELRRCLVNRKILVLLFGIFLLNVFFFSKEQREYFGENQKEYKMAYASLVDKYSMNTMDKSVLDKLEEEYKENKESYNLAVIKVITEASSQVEYKDFLLTIQENVEKSNKFAVFSDPNSFSYKNIRKTAKDFEGLESLQLTLVQGQALEQVITFPMVDYFIIFILLVIIIKFLEERKLGLWSMIHSGVNGRYSLALQRSAILALASGLLIVLFYGGHYIVSCLYYGEVNDYFAPIQSISLLKQCNETWSIAQFMIHYILLKWMILFGITMFIWLVMSIFKNTTFSIAVVILLLLVEYFCYTFISEHSAWNILKYMNLLVALRTYLLYAKYTNIQIFGNLFLIKTGIHTMLMILVPVILTVTVVISGRKRPFNDVNFLGGVQDKVYLLRAKLWKSTSIFIGESRKIFIGNKGILILLLLVYIQMSYISQDTLLYTAKDIKINEYYNTYAGRIGDQVEDFISDSLENLKQATKAYEYAKEEYDSKRISEDEWKNAKRAYMIAGMSSEAFFQFQNDVSELKQYASESGEYVEIVNPISYEYFFDQKDRMDGDYLAIKALIFVILLSSSIMAYEKQARMTNILRVGVNGHRRLLLNKCGVLLIVSLLVWILTYGIELYNMYYLFGFHGLSSPIKSLKIFRGVPFNCSILVFYLLVYSLRYMGIVAVAALTMLVSSYCSNTKSAITFSVICIGGTSILYYIGIPQLKKFAIVNTIHVMKEIGVNNSLDIGKMVIVYLISMIACCVCIRNWCNTKG